MPCLNLLAAFDGLLHQFDLVESDCQAVPPLPQHTSFAVDKALAEIDAQPGATGVDFPHDPADTAERPAREIDDIARPIFGKPHAARVIQVNSLRSPGEGQEYEANPGRTPWPGLLPVTVFECRRFRATREPAERLRRSGFDGLADHGAVRSGGSAPFGAVGERIDDALPCR